MKKVCLKSAEILSIVFFVLMWFYPVSCKVNEEGIKIVPVEESSPEINEYSVNSSDNISVYFSKKVSVVESKIFDEEEDFSHEVISQNPEESENLWKIDFVLNKPLKAGKNYELYGIVEDETGNTLTFSLPVSGYNERIPSLRITEVRPMYAKTSKSVTVDGEKSKIDVFKAEFIEFEVLSDGNLCSVEIVSAYDGEEKNLMLPDVEVKQGEIVVVHLRLCEGETGGISELEDDITLSTGYYSSDFARDIWFSNSDSHLGDKQDVVFLRDSQTGKILDAVLYSLQAELSWKNDSMKSAIDEIKNQEKWNFINEEDIYSMENAYDVTGITNTKSFYRIKEESAPDSWVLSLASKETPGEISEELKKL